MKKNTPKKLLIALFSIFSFNSFAQCPDGDVTLNSQEDIDQFIIDYPNCTEISGELKIISDSNSEILNFNGLNNISTVTGKLIILNNSLFENFDGLNFTSIGGLEIKNNALEDIFIPFTEINGDLIIKDNDHILDLEVLQNIISIEGDILIEGNSLLHHAGSIQSLQNFDGNITIRNNDNLSSMIFDTGISIQKFEIDANESMTSLSITNDNLIIDELIITNNTNLYELNLINKINSQIKIINNPEIDTIDFSEIIGSEIGAIEITDNASVQSINFTNLNAINGNLIINDNNELVSINSESITDLQGGITIAGNALLNEIGLSNVTELHGINIRDNNALETINIASNSSTISDVELTNNDHYYGGSPGPEVYNNSSLKIFTIGGFDKITSNTIRISHNPLLENLTILNFENGIESELDIIDNGNGMNLDLPDLKKITYLLFDQNSIASINIPNLEEVELFFEISENNFIDNSVLNLPNLNFIGNVKFIGNENLEEINFQNLNELTNVDDYLFDSNRIENNSGLKKINFSSILEFKDFMQISGNEEIEEVNFESLKKSVGININGEESLTTLDLDALEEVNEVPHDFDIWYSEFGLVINNTKIEDIKLNALTINVTRLEIKNNSELQSLEIPCEVLSSLYWNGEALSIVIIENGEYIFDIEEYCPEIINIEEEVIHEFSILPNPAKNKIRINTDLDISQISIVDLTGRTVLKTKETQNINIISLEKGVYFLNISDSKNNTMTEKFIKE
ncbi:T9SS type A sorting domain-containing protein [Aureivirga sp. CE67]|uniref:T9SS type A sorting domain-containing protein n=1 Tax=Aureivirga sp. CE67 TaxID=1788983 RepID=UPI0018C9F1FA|nr:T9SS type A sorting domain-containing protein [Aureivirga sp. CE67]